jgi:hypothetical protein
MVLVAQDEGGVALLRWHSPPPGLDLHQGNGDVWNGTESVERAGNQGWLPWACAPPEQKIRQNSNLDLGSVLEQHTLLQYAEESKNSSRLLAYALGDAHGSGHIELVDVASQMLEDKMLELAVHHNGSAVACALVKYGSEERRRVLIESLLAKDASLAKLCTSVKGTGFIRYLLDLYGDEQDVLAPLIQYLLTYFGDLLSSPTASYVYNKILDRPEQPGGASRHARLQDVKFFGNAQKIRALIASSTEECMMAGWHFSYTLAKAIDASPDKAERVRRLLAIPSVLGRLHHDTHPALLEVVIKADAKAVKRLYSSSSEHPPSRVAALLRHALRSSARTEHSSGWSPR